ncbi:MAG: guanylate kinase [Candidatus Cloacimonadales bacterium]
MTNIEKNKFLIILIAPSGGGKTTIGRAVLEREADVDYSVSFTTRQPRGNEVDRIDYCFISQAEFRERIKNGDFLEHANVHGNLYGTSRSFIETRMNSGKHVLLDLDVQGAQQIMSKGVNAVTIFILPPSEEVLKERLNKRGTDSQDVIERRLTNAVSEIDQIANFEYLVINDSLEKAIEDVIGIIRSEEKRIERLDNIKEKFYGG